MPSEVTAPAYPGHSALEDWGHLISCPIDHSPLDCTVDGRWSCPTCDFKPELTSVGQRDLLDFRAIGHKQVKQITVQIPVVPLQRDRIIDEYFTAINARFDHYPREQISKQFGTRLDKGIQYYCQQLLREIGPDAQILDLGCGNGGTRRYLETLGFRHILAVDWIASGADILVDAHRLPFGDRSFHMVISTAVLEHLYNPFLAMSEISRVLRSDGYYVGSASFWESWHASSYFHLTPDGWHAILEPAGLTLEDFWPGWGIIPSTFFMVLIPLQIFLYVGYGIQAIVDTLYRVILGEREYRKFRLRASGSYLACARKRLTKTAPES